MEHPSISRILNFRIALVVVCVNVFICFIFMVFFVRLAERDFENIIAIQTKHLANTFTQQLWLFDLTSTELLAAMAVDAPDIAGLRLYDHDYKILVDKGDMDKQSDLFMHRELRHDEGTVVGYLDITFTNSDRSKQRNLILMISCMIVLPTVGVTAILIHWVLKHYLITPLRNLQSDMKALADGRFHGARHAGQSSEIRAIVEGFNQMTAALADREEKRQRAEMKSGASQQRYLSLFQDSKDSIFTMTMAGTLVDVNPAMHTLLGYTKQEMGALGMENLFLLKEDLLRLQHEVESRGSVNDYQVHLQSKSGEGVSCLLSASLWKNEEGKILGIQGILRDKTQEIKARKQQAKLEKELRQKYKMEAVGLMAGGIAHNFNNNLAIILGNLELAQLQETEGSKVSDYLANAVLAVQRSRDLTRQILTYSRQGNTELVPLQPALIVDETLKLIRSTIPTTVQLSIEIDEALHAVRIEADATRIQEALINLCNNSVQAMDESGLLAIRMSLVRLEDSDIPARYDCAPGEFVCLVVEDNGCGMPGAIMERIFDPFFTTKSVDQGTGMGLATVQGIVEQHNGLVKVVSREGEGTQFSLYFPVHQNATKIHTTERGSTLLKGSERILFVDDDAMLVQLGEAMLSTLGYQVVAESDSIKALELLKAEPCQFDILITDQTMPGLTGLELTYQLHRIRPGFPVILCTGYSSKASAEEIDTLNIEAFCMKPLELGTLAGEIRRVLDRRAVNG